MTDKVSAEALAEQIGAVEETIAELQADPLLYHVQAGPVIDLRIARLTAVIATLKEFDAAYRRGVEAERGVLREYISKLEALGEIKPSTLSNDAVVKGIILELRALAPPQEN